MTLFKLFKLCRMPFGLRNAGMTFQCLMESILKGLPHMFLFLDDILITSPTFEDQCRDVAAVLRILQANGLVINASKCIFGVTAVEILGHQHLASLRWPTGSPLFAVFLSR
jgi:Reverse transcriptase (RNA-dependent DNA polymerase)